MHLKLLALALFCYGTLAQTVDVAKEKRQVGSVSLAKDDHQAAESHFGHHGHHGHHHHHGKFYQYAHVPAHDHYEHGHKRGNEHHFIERHEKAHPHHGEFKTKVRWGDKHGGYGEHYWDYNHDGHHHDGHHHDGHHHGEETQQKEEYAVYDETKNAPQIYQLRNKRQPKHVGGDVEFINDEAKELVLSGATGKHGGNYRNIDDYEREKREQKFDGKSLVFETKSGRVIDESTGIEYELKPIDY